MRIPYFTCILKPHYIGIVLISICTFHSCLTAGDGIIGDEITPGSMVTMRADYPEGPYGKQTGSIIDNITFTQSDDSSLSLADLHGDYSNRLLLVALASADCSLCISQQEQIEKIYQNFNPRGLNILLTLVNPQNELDLTPNADSTKAWQQKHSLSFPIVFDANTPSVFTEYSAAIGQQGVYLLIDVQSMEILQIQEMGDLASITQQIDETLPVMIKSDEYPPPPYGVKEGKIIENLSFNSVNGDEFSFNDIYQDHSKRLLLLTTSAEWCTACIKEQPELEKLYQRYGDQGLDVLVIMFQDANFSPATINVASNWQRRYRLSFHVVADNKDPSTMSPYYDIALTPMVMLVDLEEMRMIYISQGFDEDAVQAYLNSYF
jgi:glutathione peroxidase-family protein